LSTHQCERGVGHQLDRYSGQRRAVPPGYPDGGILFDHCVQPVRDFGAGRTHHVCEQRRSRRGRDLSAGYRQWRCHR
jgi:hypothetical protein